MAHPVGNEHRADKVEKKRVHDLCRGGYASGGRIDSGERQYAKAAKGEAHTARDDGDEPKRRADRPNRAKGGRVKHGKGHKTNVNVIVAPSGGPQAGLGPKPPAPPPGLAPPAPPPMAAKPPMPMPPPGGMPPGMPMRAKGGRVPHDKSTPERSVKGVKVEGHGKMAKAGCRADGGKVPMPKPRPQGKEPDADDLYSGADAKRLSNQNRAKGGKVVAGANEKGKTGIGFRLPVQHSGNKDDTQNIGRKKPVTYATGGAIYSDGREGKQMGPPEEAGSRSGLGRIAKAHRAARLMHG